jgi:hypothetical protein
MLKLSMEVNTCFNVRYKKRYLIIVKLSDIQKFTATYSWPNKLIHKKQIDITMFVIYLVKITK